MVSFHSHSCISDPHVAEAINEQELERAAAEGSYKRAKTEREEAMVQTDVLRLEVKRLRDALNGRADEVFTLVR